MPWISHVHLPHTHQINVYVSLVFHSNAIICFFSLYAQSSRLIFYTFFSFGLLIVCIDFFCHPDEERRDEERKNYMLMISGENRKKHINITISLVRKMNIKNVTPSLLPLGHIRERWEFSEEVLKSNRQHISVALRTRT